MNNKERRQPDGKTQFSNLLTNIKSWIAKLFPEQHKSALVLTEFSACIILSDASKKNLGIVKQNFQLRMHLLWFWDRKVIPAKEIPYGNKALMLYTAAVVCEF